MSLRLWLSEMLAPDVHQDARRYHRMRGEAGDAYWWLGEFPEATFTLRWLLDNDMNRNRSLGTYAVGEWPSSIGDFRERLRQELANRQMKREEA